MFWCAKIQAQLAYSELLIDDLSAALSAIKEHVAFIGFTPDGVITEVNALFLAVVGYERDQLIGQPHRMLCPLDFVRSSSYGEFWAELAAGTPHQGVFERRAINGRPIWLEATYFPVKDKSGKVIKVLKIAADVTRATEQQRQYQAMFKSLDHSFATIEFSPDGTIRDANKNFLNVIGYDLAAIKGQHHRMFCFDDFYAQNPNFWSELAHGEFKTGLFKRKAAGGRTIWLEASYNPVKDETGRVTRVVKFAADVTARIEANQEIDRSARLAAEIVDELFNGNPPEK